MSSKMPGPKVVETAALIMYLPFELDGFSLWISSKAEPRFSSSCLAVKEALPMMK